MGRFFDAVGALLGATHIATYEGQPAMELESMASEVEDQVACYPYSLGDDTIDTRPTIQEIVSDLQAGVEIPLIAARFHATIGAFTVDACKRLHDRGAPKEVVLSGGVMQNARLVSLLLSGLREAGLEPHIHREVPPNDGGLSLGQAVVSASRSEH